MMNTKNFMFLFLSLLSSIALNAINHEKPLFVVVTSYNNEPWVKKNLDSIFNQEYSNYQVVIIDDVSSDKTIELIENYIKEHNLQDKATLIVNEKRQRKLNNLFYAYYLANDWDIIVQIDGDDWLPNNKIFQQINAAYSMKDTWLTYGSFVRGKKIEKPNTEPEYVTFGVKFPPFGPPRKVIDSNSFRSWDWVFTHLKTFYAWLFKQIKLEDFIVTQAPGFKGTLYPFANDMAMMIPMIEMASKNHFHWFTSVTYIASLPIGRVGEEKIDYTPIVRACVNEIRNSPRYTPLTQPILRNLEKYRKSNATIILIADDVSNIDTCLHSINTFVKGYDEICVLHQKPITINTTSQNIKNFNLSLTAEKERFREYFSHLITEHILLVDSNNFFISPTDLHSCIYFLEKSYAYGFYFYLDLAKKPAETFSTALEKNIHVWKFKFSKEGEWSKFNNINGILYKKSTLTNFVENIKNQGLSAINEWKKEEVGLEKIGLFYQESTITY